MPGFLNVAVAAYEEVRRAVLLSDTARAQMFLDNCFPGMSWEAKQWLLDPNNVPLFSDDGNQLIIEEL